MTEIEPGDLVHVTGKGFAFISFHFISFRVFSPRYFTYLLPTYFAPRGLVRAPPLLPDSCRSPHFVSLTAKQFSSPWA